MAVNLEAFRQTLRSLGWAAKALSPQLIDAERIKRMWVELRAAERIMQSIPLDDRGPGNHGALISPAVAKALTGHALRQVRIFREGLEPFQKLPAIAGMITDLDRNAEILGGLLADLEKRN